MMDQRTQVHHVDAIDVRLEEVRLENDKQVFNDKLALLAQKVVEFERKRGPQDPLTRMLAEFFQALAELNDLIAGLNAVAGVFECLRNVIGFSDRALNLVQSPMLLDAGQAQDGFFARVKRRRAVKRAFASINKEFDALVDGVVVAQEMMNRMSTWINKYTGKMSAKSRKIARNQTQGGTGVSAAKRYLSGSAPALSDNGADGDL